YGQGAAGPRAGGGDDVVAAGMPDARQRVVLAQDGDGGPLARLEGRAEGGVHPRHPRFDLEALGGEELGQPPRRLRFLVRQLPTIVDAAGTRVELARAG